MGSSRAEVEIHQNCYEVSDGQRSLWLHQQFSPDDPFYNIVTTYRLIGGVIPSCLQEALNQLVQRHESLRTTFHEKNGELTLSVHPNFSVLLPSTDLRCFGELSIAVARALLRHEGSLSINVSQFPITRFYLYQVNNNDYYFSFIMHHIITDGWSLKLFMEELWLAYKSVVSNVRIAQDLSGRSAYTNFIAWQRSCHEAYQQSKSFGYWIKKLEQLPLLKLPYAKSRPVLQTFCGKKIFRIIPVAITNQLKEVCQQHLATPAMAMLAIFQLLLHRYSKQNDFAIGVPFANRAKPEFEKVMGYFVNTVPIRTNINNHLTFLEYLKQVRSAVIEAMMHQDISFEKIIPYLSIEKELGYPALFQVMFIYQDVLFPSNKDSGVGFSYSYEEIDHNACVFDLTFEIRSSDGTQFYSFINFNTDLISDDDASQLLEHFEIVLNQALSETNVSLFDLTQNIQHITFNRENFDIVSSIVCKAPNYIAPRTALETSLLHIWSEILCVENLGVDDIFFHSGGNSLLALQIISRIDHQLNVALSLRELFENSTIASLALLITSKLNSIVDRLPDLVRLPENHAYLLSYAQQRLWFLYLMNPNMVAYNVAGALTIQGHLNLDYLKKSVELVIERHASLRSVFKNVQGDAQLFITPFEPLPWNIEDLSADSSAIMGVLQERAAIPFNLTTGPLYRFALFKKQDNYHYFLFCFHHIIFDGWSAGIFLKEIAAYYQALVQNVTPSLKLLNYHYTDFSYWQIKCLNKLIDRQMSYWRNKLSDLPIIEFPLDKPRLAHQGYRGAKAILVIEKKCVIALKNISKNHDVTLFHVLLATYFLLISRYTSQQDIALNIPVAGRHHIELEELIGFFVTMLIIRETVDLKQTFYDFVKKIKNTVLDAFAHAEVPFEKLVNELCINRDLSRNPLTQVAFNYVDMFDISMKVADLDWTVMTIDQKGAKYDLSLMVIDQKETLRCELEYDAALFIEETVQAFLLSYQQLLSQVVIDFEKSLYQFTSREVNPNANEYIPFIEDTVLHQFKKQVQQQPLALAMKSSNKQLTYQELDVLSDALASQLIVKCGHGKVVSLFIEHDVNMLISIIGVLKTRGCYVPLNIYYPKMLVDQMIVDAEANIIIVSNITCHLFQSNLLLNIINIDELDFSIQTVGLPMISPYEKAYILYTSGSTGRPKGVVQNHRNLFFQVNNYVNTIQLLNRDRVLQLASYSHDAAIVDIFSTLIAGACLYPISLKTDGVSVIHQFIKQNDISIFHSTPTVFRTLYQSSFASEQNPTVRIVTLGGEEVFASDVYIMKQNFSPACWMLNLFGSTECSFSLAYFINDVTQIKRYRLPIGIPVPGIEVVLYNDQGQEAEWIGECVYRSSYLSLGYLQVESPEDCRFFVDEQGRRLYRTGDIFRRLPDGIFEHIGRKDHQVKIRGYRIDLAQVQQVFQAHPAIKEVAVITKEDAHLGRYILVFYVPYENNVLSEKELLNYAKDYLPDYMLPQKLILLNSLSTNVHGKIDRSALSNFNIASAPLSIDMEPVTIIEKELILLWKNVLGNSIQIGINHGFFELGGHSLLLVKLHALIQQSFSQDIRLIDLFKFPTIRSFAYFLEGNKQQHIENGGEYILKRKAARLANAKRYQKVREYCEN